MDSRLQGNDRREKSSQFWGSLDSPCATASGLEDNAISQTFCRTQHIISDAAESVSVPSSGRRCSHVAYTNRQT